MNDGPAGRRPLKTRSWPIFQKIAASLAASGLSPNAISVFSVFMAMIGAVGLVATSFEWPPIVVRLFWLMSLLGIQGRLICNLLDGMVAVEGGKGSPVGQLYNEVPDRISDPILFVAAGYALGGSPAWGWAAACSSLFVAYVRALAATAGCGQIFAGPMAKQQRMALLTAVCIAGVLLPTSVMSHDSFAIMRCVLIVIVVGCVVTSIRRLLLAGQILRNASKGSL